MQYNVMIQCMDVCHILIWSIIILAYTMIVLTCNSLFIHLTKYVSFIFIMGHCFLYKKFIITDTGTIKHPTFLPFGCSQWDSNVNFFSTENERLSSFTAEYRKWVSIILYSRALRITQYAPLEQGINNEWVSFYTAEH